MTYCVRIAFVEIEAKQQSLRHFLWKMPPPFAQGEAFLMRRKIASRYVLYLMGKRITQVRFCMLIATAIRRLSLPSGAFMQG